ncbi:aromatic amino acid ammonia-lyase [Acinetobacter sp. C32I]|uniref:HAL/PAL/TAL family ammonia-lyase n=1 Tax=Acinetobacter sp. C32I TaxID=2950074 RepID=UPI002037220C|nr:aromatic amino acid ammonia-lyase [Acinetobacter sp. C32I]USA55358.1 aromatic amino acid ammonia-lyase [Acinetobacter sp. C32I]
MTIQLGDKIDIETFIQIARFKSQLEFSEHYVARVKKSRAVLEDMMSSDEPMYGITTGFGALCSEKISQQQTAELQENLILSHAVSVGEPLNEEQARACMLMILQNLGQGYSGVRFEVLERIRQFLNLNLVPWMPREGSVGYLAPEAHLALTLTGRGQLYYQGELRASRDVFAAENIPPLQLQAKEGLALISGTTSTTALASLALYDLQNAAKSADIIAALSLESLEGILIAFDERVMKVRPHPEQAQTASNIRRLLKDSELALLKHPTKLQDALSLRCIPQLHGAAKKVLNDALITIEIEMNACCDNPIVWHDQNQQEIISACNPDSSYVGLAMDTAAIAATNLAKMSERRNNRLIDGSLSGFSYFLIRQPGLNSGLMIPQYTQAALLNDMRILSHPATIDNTPTCGNQEDYVAMGYNASKKAISIADKLEYILAIELLSGYYAHQFLPKDKKRSPAMQAIIYALEQRIKISDQDTYFYSFINEIKGMIHDGTFLNIIEDKIEKLD